MGLGARKRMSSARLVALSIAIAGTEPPSEFRVFSAGTVETSKGTFLFDEAASERVMADYQKHGVDLMIDYDHASLSFMQVDPAQSGKAAGWFNLEVRNGELWATNVRWTQPAADALRRSEWRYMSPAFATDEGGRITSVLNVALTNIPATHNLEPLVAASRREMLSTYGEGTMTPEQIAQLAEILGLGADASVEDVIATVAAMVKKITDSANGTNDAPAEDPAAAAEAPPMAASRRVLAASRVLAKLSGKVEIGEMITEVEAWRKSHLDLEGQRTRLATERATLEAGERKRLVGELVVLGSETPATAWENPEDKADAQKPAEPWASMDLAKLRERVTKVRATKTPQRQQPGPRPMPGAPPDGGQTVVVRGEAVQLSGSEVAACKDVGATLEDYASNKLIRDRARAARAQS
jgi:phage I-like protein